MLVASSNSAGQVCAQGDSGGPVFLLQGEAQAKLLAIQNSFADPNAAPNTSIHHHPIPCLLMNIATHRLYNQRLVGPPLAEPVDAVRWLGAVQAQDYPGATWALAQRTDGIDKAAVDRAFNEGAFLRTHVMRPTWHFVAPEDLRWLLALTGPRVHAVNAYYYRKLELDDATLRRGHGLLAGALQGGRHRTRQELAGVLEAGGIPAQGQRLAYLVMHAELDGLLCSGPRRGNQFTYALLDERVPPVPARTHDEALAMLIRRYFASHGPATVHDFAWWSGLRVSDAKRGLALVRSHVEHMTLNGKTYWMASPAPASVELAEPTVHLLPNYDEHVVAYKDHGPSCHPAAMRALHTRGGEGLDAHLIALNGLVVGGWRRVLQTQRVVARTDLLIAFRASERKALHRAAEDYSRFMGLPVALEGAG